MRRRLEPITYVHKSEGCGQRIPSPHERCQALYQPFLAGERLHRPFATIVLCLACKAAWREAAA